MNLFGGIKALLAAGGLGTWSKSFSSVLTIIITEGSHQYEKLRAIEHTTTHSLSLDYTALYSDPLPLKKHPREKHRKTVIIGVIIVVSRNEKRYKQNFHFTWPPALIQSLNFPIVETLWYPISKSSFPASRARLPDPQ